MLGTVYAAIHGLGWLAPAFTMAIEEPKPAKLQEDPELKCRREKIVRLLHVQLMDFQTNSPDRLDTCVTTMLQMFTNILQDPDNEKYRKVCLQNVSPVCTILPTYCNSGSMCFTCRSEQTIQTLRNMSWMLLSKQKTSY